MTDDRAHVDRRAVWTETAIAPDVPGRSRSCSTRTIPERHGGTGRTIDWDRAATVAAARRVVLAGGLTPANVGDAIRTVRPYGVDVASGIEDRPGIKNAHAMQAFVPPSARRTIDVRTI